jgi:glycosyltransferase involved in cell wall biosynthesis
VQNNVYVYEVENNEQNLIKFYDEHNIFILPSYTEGHPMVLLEALSRLRPVIIFKDIEHVIGDKKGIFVADRNFNSFLDQINFIKKNYRTIQQEMKKNKLPTKEEFLSRFSDLISKSS